MEQAIAIYKFSKGIRRAKQRYVVLSFLLFIVLIAILFLSPTMRDESLAQKAGIGAISFVVMGLIFYIMTSIAIRKLSELSINLFPDRLEREGGKQKEVFFWKDIVRAEILEYPSGETVSIKMNYVNKKVIILFGFEDMEIAVKQITQFISAKDSILRKRAKINWDNPIIMILSSLLTLALFLAIQEIGETAFRIFEILFIFAFGMYNLIARPISRAQGQRWEIFETAVGVFLILDSVIVFALEFFRK